METPIKKEIVDGLINDLGIQDFAKATIREVKQVAAKAEKASGVEFIKMEMGIPGLPAAQVGVDAQVKSLQDGIAHSYPDIQGLPELKQQLDIIIDEVRRDNRGSVVSTIKTSKHGAYKKKKASTKPRKRR